ncbi:MAG: lytic transglycosylase domain-containing protein [Nanoarchaeota archaeon]
MKKEKQKATYLIGANACLIIGLLAGQVQNSRLEKILSKENSGTREVLEKIEKTDIIKDNPYLNENSSEEIEIDYRLIEEIESSGRTNIQNPKSKATGLMQITPVVIREWNEFNRNNSYTLEDMKIPEKNREVGRWYLEKRIPQMLNSYGLKDNLKNRLASYNWGIGKVKKMGGIKKDNLSEIPKETRDYIQKYETRGKKG